MAGNSFGQAFRITTAGESHGPGYVVIIDGVPPGIPLSVEDLAVDLRRRRPGQSKIVTQRDEADEAEIFSGVFEGRTTGTSLAILVKNRDQRSRDYEDIKNVYRPGHADYTYDAKYGFRDYRGGGRSSARETTVRVAAGVVAKKIIGAAFGGNCVRKTDGSAGCFRDRCTPETTMNYNLHDNESYILKYLKAKTCCRLHHQTIIKT